MIDASLSVIRDKAAEQTGSAAEIICLEDRHPNRALLDHLTETSYRLVVIGRSGKGFKGLVTDVIGGTAESLIRHATSPILIVPLSSE